MKRFIPVLVVCLLACGCNLKKNQNNNNASNSAPDPAAQAAQDKHARAVQAANDADALARAKKDIAAKIALYNTLAGEYDGTYVANENTTVNVKVRITAANVPAPAELDAINRETDVLARRDQMAIDIRTDENVPSDKHYSVTCIGEGIKPDFSQGLLAFDCSGKGGVSAPRSYSFYFDTGDFAAMTDETAEAARALSAQIGNDLVANRRNHLEGLRLSITLNPEFGSQFNGSLTLHSGE